MFRVFQLTRSRGARLIAKSLFFHCLYHFNSRAHVERDRFVAKMTFWEVKYFNSRAHVERDSSAAVTSVSTCVFQLTRSRGARPFAALSVFPFSTFQLTRSRGARRHQNQTDLGLTHFNSRAHVERDSVAGYGLYYAVISTHALTWSATDKNDAKWAEIKNFNSRVHVERDER